MFCLTSSGRQLYEDRLSCCCQDFARGDANREVLESQATFVSTLLRFVKVGVGTSHRQQCKEVESHSLVGMYDNIYSSTQRCSQ